MIYIKIFTLNKKLEIYQRNTQRNENEKFILYILTHCIFSIKSNTIILVIKIYFLIERWGIAKSDITEDIYGYRLRFNQSKNKRSLREFIL